MWKSSDRGCLSNKEQWWSKTACRKQLHRPFNKPQSVRDGFGNLGQNARTLLETEDTLTVSLQY